MTPIQHVLVATDFGPASERALESAAEIAVQFDAKLTVLHVLEPPYPYPVGVSIPLPTTPLDGFTPVRLQELDATVASVRPQRPDAQGVLRYGSPWTEVVAAAKELGADLIVIGSHGRRGLPHWLLGSVAERVVRMASVPVLTVHGYWFEDRVDAGRQLANAVASMRVRTPVVLAISQGGIVVGAEVARACGVSLDALLTRDVQHAGVTLGALCEEGTVLLDPEVSGVAVSAEQRERIVSETRESLNDEALCLRGGRRVVDLWRRTVILVSDELIDPRRALAAARAVGKMGPDRVIVAAPIATGAAIAALRADLPEILVLHPLRVRAEPSAAYRDFREPQAYVLMDLLRGVTATAA